MTARRSWAALKSEHPMSEGEQAGYDRARRAYALGQQIRTLREQRGVSQSELARRLNLPQSMIARWEAGGAEPRIATLDRVSAALDAELVVEFRPRPVTAGAEPRQ